MREISLTVPEIILIAGTRVALGIGIGLLLSGRLSRDARKGAGVKRQLRTPRSSIEMLSAVREWKFALAPV